MNSFFSSLLLLFLSINIYAQKNIGVKTNDKEVGIDYAEITSLEVRENFTKLSIVFLESSNFRFDESINTI